MIGEIFHGHNLKKLKELKDNSIDAVVTDAPYGMSEEPNAADLLRDWVKKGFHKVKAKKGFKNLEWDSFVPQPAFWKEVIRVLKPGGYVLCFFHSRTYDWGTMAMRLAGFEIRDCIMWMYGQGFPKSTNVSKAIDKHFGLERKVIGQRQHPTLKKKVSTDNAGPYHGKNKQSEFWDITESASKEAKKYEGWGTALKPAYEPVVMARKPLEGTIAENYLKWGTGGINIDGCRILFESEEDLKSATWRRGTDIRGANFVGATEGDGKTNVPANPAGRFPANVMFDEMAADLLDLDSGMLRSGSFKPVVRQNREGREGKMPEVSNYTAPETKGGASRFFYVAKPTQEEKDEGLDKLPFVEVAYSNAANAQLKKGKKAGVTSSIGSNNIYKVKNPSHTVKPIALMRELVRLVTPKDGVVLDPFFGSGTTGCACEMENIKYIGIEELEPEFKVAKARCVHWNIVSYEKRVQIPLFQY